MPKTETGDSSGVQANRQPAAQWTESQTTGKGKIKRQENYGLDQVHPQRRTRVETKEEAKADSFRSG